ncbi:MAG: hypothetical protein AB8H47_25100, partial [Bacteroidia bacterium]
MRWLLTYRIQAVLLCLCGFLIYQPTWAQNNAIFAGGNSDGFSLSCFLQASGNLVFAGGIGDGFDQACFVLASGNNIFAGGGADGFDQACFILASGNNIFAGGEADGFDQACFILPAGNNIFAGGDADGFVQACFFQPSNSLIFVGGIGDGFDFSQFLFSPIFTVELLSFDGIYDEGDAWLTWITETEINNSHFNLERSLDSQTFEQIATVPGAGTTSEMQIYEYRDPLAYLMEDQQRLYYRLRQVDFDGRFQLSNIVEVRLQTLGNSARVFPNPTSSTLFLQLEGAVDYPVKTALFDLHGRQLRQTAFPANPTLSLYQVD